MPAVRFPEGPVPQPPSTPLVFRIRGLDCAEEIALLKRELAPICGVANLAFDLLAGRLTVVPPPGAAPADPEVFAAAVRRGVARAGLEALPWVDPCAPGVCPVEEGFWRRRGRIAACAGAAVLIAAGFAVHAAAHGLRHALAGAEPAGAALPLTSRLFYLAAVVAGGRFTAPRAWRAARRLRPDMNLLMTVAVLGALAIGDWLEAASVTFLFAFALLLESWSVGRARRAIATLVALTPRTGRYLCPHDGDLIEQPVAEIPLGVTALVRPHERIPLDGIVTRGESAVNEAPLTGESIPVTKRPGDEVFAGAINGDGALELRVTKAAADTTLARIIRLVEQAQARRAPSELWVEKFARVYTPAMMGLALAVAVLPPLLGHGTWSHWFYQALVLLVIACPCALVIATPVSIVAGLTTAARAGVLIKGGVFLEAPARLRAVALDKTGTLTRGRPEVQEIVTLDADHTPAQLLARAAALEEHSSHPLAAAVLRRARADGLTWTPAVDVTARPGLGAEGTVDGRRFWIGSHRFMHDQDGETPACHAHAAELERAGRSVVALGTDGHVCGLFGVSDTLRPEAAAAVRGLRDAGVRAVVMLTGDHEAAARAMSDAAGLDSYAFDLLPVDKLRRLEMLRDKYGPVAMVGDGVNDTPAMAAAALGIAMAGTGGPGGAPRNDAALETADIVLLADDLTRFPWLIHHSRRVHRVIRENIVFALVVKGAFVALTVAGEASLWMAIAADMGASLAVIFNSLRLLDGGRNRAA
jgi:Cd2+/Zn2+-exporting ATPase